MYLIASVRPRDHKGLLSQNKYKNKRFNATSSPILFPEVPKNSLPLHVSQDISLTGEKSSKHALFFFSFVPRLHTVSFVCVGNDSFLSILLISHLSIFCCPLLLPKKGYNSAGTPLPIALNIFTSYPHHTNITNREPSAG